MRMCSVDECRGKHKAKGLCAKHYKRTPAQREQHRLQMGKWRPLNRDKDRAATAKYRAANPDKVYACEKASRAKKPEERSRYLSKYHADHREEIQVRHSEWVAANPEIVNASQATKRARKRGAEGRHTGREVKRLFELQRGCCAVCKCALTKYHKDHVIPLAGGGSNWIANIQLLCPPCNQSKHATDPITFMQRRGFLL